MREGGHSSARGETRVEEPTQAQRAFARTVAESKATAPHVYFECAIEAPASPAALVAASARALREVPRLNAAYRDARFEIYSRVNVAFAVPAGDSLAFPVIRDADEKVREAIDEEMTALSQRAAAGELTSPELAAATFTVISLPAAERFTPIVNRGQAATLGAGSRTLVLACDNRIAQAGEGAELLAAIAGALS